VGAVSGAALANDPVKGSADQKPTKQASQPANLLLPVQVAAPTKVAPGKALPIDKGPEIIAPPGNLRGVDPNDLCTGAIAMGALPASIMGDTSGNTIDAEAGACAGGGLTSPSLWYTFVGTGEQLTVSTCGGAAWDTYLRVLEGTCGAFSCIGVNDDSQCGPNFTLQSTISFPSVAGTTYYVYISGFSSSSGPFTLTVSPPAPPPPPPANDECAGAIAIACGSTTIADNSAATLNPADPVISCHFGSPQQGDGSIWYTFTATDTSARLTTCNSVFPADDSLITVYDTCGGTELACGEDFCGLLTRTDVNGLTIGATYTVMLTAYDPASQGAYTLELTCPVPVAPPGDECASAFPLAVPSITSGDTSGYDADAGVPFCGVIAGSPTVWYAITGTGATIVANTCGSFYDTGLSVFTGDCGALTCVVANDDSVCNGSFTLQSGLTFNANAGQVYYIVVGGFGGQSGAYTLDVQALVPPPNDECATAAALSCGTTVLADTLAGTTNPADPAFSCHFNPGTQGFGSVWYDFTAGDTSARFTTCAINAFPADDSLIAMYDACGGIEIGCNDDFCGFLSRMDVSGLTVGQVYKIQFAAWSPSDQAVYSMDVTCPIPPIPPGDECPTAFPIAALPFNASGDTTNANPDGGIPACGVGAASNSVWYQMTGNGNLIRATLCNGTTYDSGIAVFSGPDCNSLTCVANDDDFCAFIGPSQVTFLSNAGENYYIVVRGFGTAFGAYVLDVTDIGQPGPGDFCATAIPATVPSTVTGDTSVYTPDSGLFCGVIANSPTVWYSVVGNGNRFRATLCNGTTYDSGVSIFTGPDCNSLTCVASDDDFCAFIGPSQVTWDTLNGQTYYVVIGGFGTSSGFYSADLVDIGPPCDLTIPGGADLENEPDCGLPTDTVNGGCNSVPQVFSTVECGTPMFGSTAWDPSIGFRDTDWYLFVLDEDDTVNVSVRGESGTVFGLIGDGIGPIPYPGDPGVWCGQISQINPFLVGTDDCMDSTVSASLTSGTYVVFVSTLFAANAVICGTRNDYVLTVDVGGGCGGTDCNQNGIVDSVEIAGNAALDCYNPAIIANPNVIGGADGALDACQCQGDFNRNNAVNSTDISAMLTGWLASVQGPNLNGDINCSGSTNSSDVSAFLTVWLAQVQNVNPWDGCP